MGDLRPQGSMGPVGQSRRPTSTSTLLPDTRGKVPFLGYENRIMQEFIASNNGNLPEDSWELNAFIKYNKPDWPMLNEAQFKDTIASFHYGEEIREQKESQKAADANKKRLAQLRADEGKILTRLKKESVAAVKAEKEALDSGESEYSPVYDMMDAETQQKYRKSLLPATMRDRIMAEDPEYNILKEEMNKAKAEVSRPGSRRTAEKERPSGGGSIVVTGKPKSAKDAKQGTILTTQGAYGEAKQYKFTPIDEAEEGRPYAGRYRVSRPKPGTFNTWEDGGEVTADELYTRTRGDYGTPKPTDEAPVQELPGHWLPDREVPARELPAPPMPGGESVYEEFGMDPRMEEPIVEPEPRQALLPPGYPGIDEEYADPYAGYQYDERDVTELGLTPRGFYRELFGY